jgi:predicted anti-sigma-YlaC factor YlaD
MTCQELVELVTDYLEGAMPGSEHERFDEHLGNCPYCVIYLDQMRQVIAALGRLDAESLSPEAKDALLSGFRNWKQR